MSTVITTRHSCLERQSSKRDRRFESHCGKDFFHFVVLFFFRDSQLKSLDNTNEINRDIHLAFILFYLENSMFVSVQFSFKKDRMFDYSSLSFAPFMF